MHVIGQCMDTNSGLKDVYGEGCDYYKENGDECGDYDETGFYGFKATTMCCACGGGKTGNVIELFLPL